jgi:hypothetical protein
MKTLNNTYSSFKTPLTEILGRKSHILVLRQILCSHEPITHSIIIERTELSKQGVYDTVSRLVDTGLLTYKGGGRHQRIEIRTDFPLYDSIQQLFKAEKVRFDRFLSDLKGFTNKLIYQPKSVWIFGPVAKGTDRYGDPVQIALLGSLKKVDSMTEQFRSLISKNQMEQNADITIDIRGVTIADLETKPYLTEGNPIVIYGVAPFTLLESYTGSTSPKINHKEIDASSEAHAKIWAEFLDQNPTIINRTIDDLETRLPEHSGGEKKELNEWLHILKSMPIQRLKKFLTSDTERSVRLRQSLPFWPVLNESERNKWKKLASE